MITGLLSNIQPHIWSLFGVQVNWIIAKGLSEVG